jgi:single-strand DNA-binding protein
MMFLEILGNLGRDAETRYTQNGSMITQLNVAVNSRRKDKDGEYQERTDWFAVRVGGAKAEYVGRFAKGNRVLVRGRLEIGQYTVKSGPNVGEVRTSYDIWADEVINLSPRDQEQGDRELASTATAGAREDLPF